MKLLISTLLLFFIIAFSCNAQKNKNAQNTKSMSDPLLSKIEKIELVEQSRGVNRLYTYTKEKKIIELNGTKSVLTMPASEWEKICKEVNLLNLSEIENLQSPTTKRFSDAALSSHISIFIDGKVYLSSSFDAGVPNEKLKSFYNALKDPSGIILQKSKKIK